MARKTYAQDDDFDIGTFRPIATQEMQDLKKEMRHAVLRSELSEDQDKVFDQILEWNEDKKAGQVLTLGGYAGTGKSTLISVFASLFEDKAFAYCALTGKASNVIQQKLNEADVHPSSSHVGTIHSLLYTPIANKATGAIIGWRKKKQEAGDSIPYELIVVDEASMVDERIFGDLYEWGVPILAVGDHGQLPPVFGDFNLMESPELRLEKIHRQAEGAPILALSEYIRESGAMPLEFPHDSVRRLSQDRLRQVISEVYGPTAPLLYKDIAFLCYTNMRRRGLNALVREHLFQGEKEPQVGDQLICLKNAGRIFNGMRGELRRIKRQDKHWYDVTLAFPEDGFEWEGLISAYQFGREVFKDFGDLAHKHFFPRSWREVGLLFDFGYALTVHKAQGSGFKHVVLSYERPNQVDHDSFRRWLYTAATRSSDKLTIVG